MTDSGGIPAGRRVKAELTHAALRDALMHDRESAWITANYERGQRDEYTSKIRFGLAALNAASLVTILNLTTLTKDLDPRMPLAAATAFLVGTMLAGYSLLSHQAHLITLSGATSRRAMLLDRAVLVASQPLGSDPDDGLGSILAELQAIRDDIFAYSASAMTCQWLAGVIWGAASIALALTKVASVLR